MSDDRKKPKEHPTFHRNSMLGGFLLLGVAFLLGGISIYADKQGKEPPIPGWTGVALVALFFGWVFYRTLLARPRCPVCHSKDTEHRFDYSADISGQGYPREWRRFRCRSCEAEFLIPGLSSDG